MRSPTSTANVINLGDEELIVNRSNRGVIERLAGTKYVVHDLDLVTSQSLAVAKLVYAETCSQHTNFM